MQCGGHSYVFTTRQRNRLRLLYWDGTGLWLFSKRLEKGTFAWTMNASAEPALQFTGQQLLALIQGIELHERRGWYRTSQKVTL